MIIDGQGDALPSAFGARLRTVRASKSLSLGQLARVAGYSKGHLSNVESGNKLPSPALAKRLEQVLGLDGDLVSLLPGRSAPAPADDPATPALTHLWALRMPPGGGVEFHARDRLVPDEGVTWVSTAPPHTPDSVNTLAAFFASLRKLGQSLPPAMMISLLVPAASALRSAALSGPDSQRAEALRLCSRYLEYLGWMAQEDGDDRAAGWWTDQAVDLASAGGDVEMANYALIRRAEIALYQDDFPRVISLARQAQAATANGRIRELAAQREAQGHALGGDEYQAMNALDRAASLASAAQAEQGEEAFGSTMPNTLSFVTAWSLYELGRWHQTAELLQAQYQRLPQDAYRTRARYGARLALSLAHQRELAQACAVAELVLAEAGRAGSATARADLRLLYRTLIRLRQHPRVREILPAFAAVLHRTV